MSTEPVTKKEKILRLASEDPFMSVANIATAVDTSARYVRTALSESGVSLGALRREYVQRMENCLRRSEIEVAVADEAPIGQIQIEQIEDAVSARRLHLSDNVALLRISLVRQKHGNRFLEVVLTPRQVIVEEQLVNSDQPLSLILGLRVPGKSHSLEACIEVVLADEALAAHLGLVKGAAVLVHQQILTVQGVRTGLETCYWDACRYRLQMADPDQMFDLIEKRGTAP